MKESVLDFYAISDSMWTQKCFAWKENIPTVLLINFLYFWLTLNILSLVYKRSYS